MVTDEMVEAACKVWHTARSWNKAARNPEMNAWLTSQRAVMRSAITAALAAYDRDVSDVWEEYLTEIGPKPEVRSEQAALAFGYAAGRP